MKALSIKQPWAWLICAGYKDIENRNWKIGRNPRHGTYSTIDVHNFSINMPERIYVHAPKKDDDEAWDFVEQIIADMDLFWKMMNKPFIESLAHSSIIGEVDITGCVTNSLSPWFIGKYGFTLANPKLYEHPIPYRGRLGFFEVEL